MIIAILIFFVIILILSIRIELNIKSADDTLKMNARIAFFSFVIPHQRLITKAIQKEKEKTLGEQRKDFFKMLQQRGLLLELFKHSSLNELYLARFSQQQLYDNPIANGLYLATSASIKSFASRHFKQIESSKIQLVYKPNYENIDYFISFKTDVIGVLITLIKSKKKGKS